MRDALSALDQVLAFTSDRVTMADVSTVLGLIGRDLQFEIVETVAREDAAGRLRRWRTGSSTAASICGSSAASSHGSCAT